MEQILKEGSRMFQAETSNDPQSRGKGLDFYRDK